MTGIIRSSRMADGRIAMRCSNFKASRPWTAVTTSKPRSTSASASTSRMSGSSSTIRTGPSALLSSTADMRNRHLAVRQRPTQRRIRGRTSRIWVRLSGTDGDRGWRAAPGGLRLGPDLPEPRMEAHPVDAPRSAIPVGTRLGNYQVVRLIGEGGMGAVYEGVHLAIGKKVAIKIMSSDLAANLDARARFLREAQLTSR